MRLAFSLLAVFICQIVFAQLKQFSEEPNKFISEMTSLYTALENKNDRKNGEAFMLEKFTPFWNGGILVDKQKATIINNCNLMLKKK